MAQPKIVAIIQARMAASRLPGKVLAELGEQKVLDWVVHRAARTHRVDQVLVATSTETEDNEIVAHCESMGYAYFRGSLHDVLDRYYQAAKANNADIVLRITADCPLIDPRILDNLIESFLHAEPALDFAANRLPYERTIPIGLDAEMCSFAALETAWKEAKSAHQREHVMPFFYENEGRFRILHVRHEENLGHYRWTLDTQEDLLLLREIVSQFRDDNFGWLDVLALIRANPELQEINAGVIHKSQKDVDQRL